MKYVILILSSLLFIACKQNSESSITKVYEAPRSHPFAESVHMEGYSDKGKAILHQLYTKNSEVKNLFEVDFASNDRFEKTHAKVYIISKEKDQLYYFPLGTSKKWIEENVDVFRYSHYKMYWINSELSLKEPSFLVVTNERDVLLNEQNFSIQTFILEKVSSVELKHLSKYQALELEMEKYKINPGLYLNTKTKVSGRDCGDERPRPCICNYEINSFNNNYNIDNAIPAKQEEIKYKMFLDNEFVMDSTGSKYKKSFLPENDFTDFKLDFESDYYLSSMSVQIGKSEECKNLKSEKIEGIGKYLYDIKVVIRGVSEINYHLESL